MRYLRPMLVALTLIIPVSARADAAESFSVQRLNDGPIITPHLDDRMGSNIQGPTLIRVPDWVENPLGKYYLYFADHRGSYIRLAYADDILGPWSIYSPGSLKLEQSFFPTTCPPCSQSPGREGAPLYAHIASPDVHVRDDLQQIVMYVHGRDVGRQITRLATSSDGIHFEGQPEVLGRPYFRVFEHDDHYYALAMPGYLYRSPDGLSDFEPGPRFFNDNMRHSAVLVRGDRLHVFWTQAGHAPERILLTSIDTDGDWLDWQQSEVTEVLRPELPWEGSDLPIAASTRGHIDEPVNQLRDPAIFEEDGQVYLLYSVAGERGIAISRLIATDSLNAEQ